MEWEGHCKQCRHCCGVQGSPVVFINKRDWRYTKSFNSPCSNLTSDGTKNGVQLPPCPVLVL